MSNNIMDEILAVFSEFGWYEGRAIEIGYMLDEFKREGYSPPSAKIKELLKSYWNLRIEFQLPNGQYCDIVLNTSEGRECLDPEEVAGLEKQIGESLLPVGTIDYETKVLLISESGKMYLLSEEGGALQGNDFWEGMFNILNKGQLKLI